jgi:hypothetical protein
MQPAKGSGPRSLPIQRKLKRTFYLDLNAVAALHQLQADELRKTGHKPDLSELVSRGIQVLEARGSAG